MILEKKFTDSAGAWEANAIHARPDNNNALNGLSLGHKVLQNNNSVQYVKRIKSDNNGNFMMLDMVIDDKEITLVNIYGPNYDNPQFYKNLKQKIEEFQNDQVIICGDWNLIINAETDSYIYVHINNPRAKQSVLHLLEQENFVDPWHLMHDNEQKYT